jgi:hypothetical protein
MEERITVNGNDYTEGYLVSKVPGTDAAILRPAGDDPLAYAQYEVRVGDKTPEKMVVEVSSVSGDGSEFRTAVYFSNINQRYWDNRDWHSKPGEVTEPIDDGYVEDGILKFKIQGRTSPAGTGEIRIEQIVIYL